ncbi:MAG: PQQ-binding-like beta-propeller repeat protein [Planctomycetota bacterium]
MRRHAAARLCRASVLGFVALTAAMGTLVGCTKPTGLTVEQRIASLPISNAEWRELGYRWDWKAAPVVGTGQGPRFTVVGPDLVVFQETGGTVSAIAAGVGSTIWENRLAGKLTRFTGAQILGDRVFVASQAELFILDATTGELVDRQQFERLVNTPPLVLGDLVVVGSNSGELMGHFVPARLKAWGHLMPGVFEQQTVDVGGIVANVTTRGRIIFVDPISKRQTGLNDIFDGPGAELGAGDGRLYVASLDQSLYAFDPLTGGKVWQKRTPDAIRAKPVYHSGVVYCSFREDGLTALDAATGETLWNNPEQRGNVVAVRNGRLLVHDGGQISLIDPQRGSRLGEIGIPNIHTITTDQFEDGNLYLTSTEGVIARFVPAG